MPTYTFKYTSTHLDASEPFPVGQDLFRPILKLRLVVPATGGHMNITALVDSGADHCMFPLAWAPALGLDPLRLKKTTTGGVGSAANVTYFESVRLEVPVSGGSLIVDAYAGFCDGVDAIGMGLLGQTGFFEKYLVAFDHRRRVFQITL